MLSIIMPAYNETPNLGRTIEETVATVEKCGLEHEVIVVDDGSTDDTYEIALSYAERNPNIRAFSYKENKGRGYALRYGFHHAQGDLVLLIDADSDLPPSQIQRLLEYMRESNADVVNSSKRHPQSRLDYPINKKIVSWGYHTMVKTLFRTSLSDTLTGLKLFKYEVLRDAFPKAVAKGFALNFELLLCAHRLGYTIVEAPVEISFHSNSHVNLRSIWLSFRETLAMFYRMKVLHYYDRR